MNMKSISIRHARYPGCAVNDFRSNKLVGQRRAEHLQTCDRLSLGRPPQFFEIITVRLAARFTPSAWKPSSTTLHDSIHSSVRSSGSCRSRSRPDCLVSSRSGPVRSKTIKLQPPMERSHLIRSPPTSYGWIIFRQRRLWISYLYTRLSREGMITRPKMQRWILMKTQEQSHQVVPILRKIPEFQAGQYTIETSARSCFSNGRKPRSSESVRIPAKSLHQQPQDKLNTVSNSYCKHGRLSLNCYNLSVNFGMANESISGVDCIYTAFIECIDFHLALPVFRSRHFFVDAHCTVSGSSVFMHHKLHQLNR